jgi:hypothetical protein
MTLSELTKGSATFAVVIVAGYLSTTTVNRHFAAWAARTAETSAPGTACVGEGGAWKNWPWPNVPTLSPKCDQ